MFKIFKRAVAYFIDMMVVLIVVQTIVSIPFINRDIDSYNEVYNNYLDSIEEYSNFRVDLVSYFDDNELDSEEYESLIKDNKSYEKVLNKYYKDNKLTKKNYEKLLKNVDNEYEKEYKKIYYNLDKYSIIYNISYLVVVFLYFVGFNMVTKGVTLGKKLTRLKIVNNKDSKREVSLLSYVIRTIILYQPIYYLSKLVFVNFLGIGSYYDVINVVYSFHTYLEFAILTFMIIRLDGRGLHDILSNTKVIVLDRNGDEISKVSLIKKDSKN